MSEEAIRDIVKAVTEAHQKSATLAGPRGKAAGDEQKKLIKGEPAQAAPLRKLPTQLEPIAQMAAMQVQSSSKVANFGKVVAEGKMTLDTAAPVANRIVKSMTQLHDRVVACRAAYAALSKKAAEKPPGR